MNTVRRDELSPGDHLFSNRKLSIYYHHGIYVGDGMVIHLMGPTKIYDRPPCQKRGFKPQAGIVETCLECFCESHSLYRCQYNVSYLKLKFKRRGSCNLCDCKPPNQVLETARQLLKDKSFGNYNFFLNNCEDFAVFCKTGKAKSNQTKSLFGSAGYSVAKAVHGARQSMKINIDDTEITEDGESTEECGTSNNK